MPTHLLDFDFSEGGQFINNPTLEIKFLPKVLKLFATFLENTNSIQKHTHNLITQYIMPFLQYSLTTQMGQGMILGCNYYADVPVIQLIRKHLTLRRPKEPFLYGDWHFTSQLCSSINEKCNVQDISCIYPHKNNQL